MDIERNHTIDIAIDNNSDIGICRRKAVAVAQTIGFDEVNKGEIAILMTELATNVIKHTNGKGKVIISQITDSNKTDAIEIWCCDSGNGIKDYDKAVVDGYTQKKSLGIGLGSICRFSDSFEINPEEIEQLRKEYLEDNPELQHCIRVIKHLPSPQWMGINKKLQTGASSRAKLGEQLNGDSYVITHVTTDNTVVAVFDGLGHGTEAHIASQAAKEQVLQKAEQPLDEIIKRVHDALRGTRGSVGAVAKIDTAKNKVFFSGIGNIECYLTTKTTKRSLVSYGGILGHNTRTPHIFENDFNEGDTLIMFSDGITSHWRFEDVDWEKQPQAISDYLLTKYSRSNDDATVLIISNC